METKEQVTQRYNKNQKALSRITLISLTGYGIIAFWGVPIAQYLGLSEYSLPVYSAALIWLTPLAYAVYQPLIERDKRLMRGLPEISFAGAELPIATRNILYGVLILTLLIVGGISITGTIRAQDKLEQRQVLRAQQEVRLKSLNAKIAATEKKIAENERKIAALKTKLEAKMATKKVKVLEKDRS